jgi:hypothetical protein
MIVLDIGPEGVDDDQVEMEMVMEVADQVDQADLEDRE